MAEEKGAAPADNEGGAPNGTEPEERDWKAEYERLLKHSRAWEDKAKRLKEKADRLDELEEASKTDAERLADANRRAEQAEERLAEYERKAERESVVAEVAASRGVDADWLARMSGDDREAIEANADWLRARIAGTPLYPSVSDGGGSKDAPLTREQIDAIKDPRERVRTRARNLNLYK